MRQSALPVMRIVSGSPITAGSSAPAARPLPLKRIEALTSPPTGPGCTLPSNGPSRNTPRSEPARNSRLWISKSPVTRVAGARSTGQFTVTERRLVRTL